MANEELGIESMHDGGNSAEEYDGELLQTNFSRGNGFSNNITTRPEEDSELDDFNDFDMHNDEEKESAMASLNLRDRERSRKMPYYEHVRKERSAIQNMTKPLKMWLYRNKAHPYPTKADKMELASHTNMTFTQVNNWFANARRRLKNTVRHPDMAWDERIRLYNSHVSANAELLSCHSGEGDGESRATEAAMAAREEEQRRRCEAAAHAVAEAAAGCLANSQSNVENLHNHHHRRGETASRMMTGGLGPIKYKQTILQRYLNDTIKYGNTTSHYPEIATGFSAPGGCGLPTTGNGWNSYMNNKQRLLSGSSGGEETPSDDCMSPNPRSPQNTPTHLLWNDELRDLQDFVTKNSPRQSRENVRSNHHIRSLYDGLNAKELGAVMALTDLALGTAR